MKKFIALLVIIGLVFGAGIIWADEPVIILDDPELSGFKLTEYYLEGEIPYDLEKIWVNGSEAEVFTKFRISVPLDKAPSYTPAGIVVKNEAGENIESYTLQVANKSMIELKYQINSTVMEVNGIKQEISAAPFIDTKNWRTMLPFRSIAENLGAEVAWVQETKTILMTGDKIKLELSLDKTVAIINGEELKLDAPAKLVDGHTFVPIRFVAETFGAKVFWDGANQSIIIKRESNPAPDFKTPKVKNTGNLILDDWEPSVLEAEHYMIEGEVPAGSSVFVNGLEAEIFKKFRITMPVKEAPSFTVINIESEDPEGEPINFKTELFVNASELVIQLWVDKTEMMVNGTPYELYAPPQVIDGSTLVPFRSITEVFGAELEWIDAIKTVKIRVNNAGGETRIELKLGSKTAKYNDQEIELDVPAQVVNGSIMVPLRFVVEAFNAELEWIADEKAIVIRQKIYP